MLFIPRRKIFVFVFFITFVSVFSFASHFQSSDVFSRKPTRCIVLDAGHGLPDGGAIGKNGTIESELNLAIAKRTQNLLTKKGYKVIMTREDEFSISKETQSISSRKKSDMRARLEIINTSDADMFVSIHMNKFTSPLYCGAQVIYSPNFRDSELLAEIIQRQLCALEDNKSKRSHLKAADGIFLLKNAKIPAVIIECGFLSNFDEEQLLNTKEYQKALSVAIADGIDKYYERIEGNENLRDR